MIRIGVVNIDTSHPKAFAEYLMQSRRARYVAVYNDGFRGDDEVEAFMEAYGLEKRCASIEELADTVDIGFVQSCNWDNHLAQAIPFMERNKPVFIDKPIVGSVADCVALERYAADGKVILGSSSLRYCREVEDFLSRGQGEVGSVLNVFGTCGVDEFNYGVHIVETIGGLLGAGARSCKFVGSTKLEGKTCETFFVRYDSGVAALYNTFHGTWQPCEVVIMTTKGTFRFRVDTSKVYGALLDRICHYMETGQNTMAPVTELTESTRIMLAGRLSRAGEGAEVQLADIPLDDPGYDGSAFERAYAEANRGTKLYLR